MNRHFLRVILMFCVAALANGMFESARAEAQAAATTRIRGEISGLELGLEGQLAVMRGEPIRWLASVYEVRGVQDLRPSVGTSVRVLASYQPASAVVETQSDAQGRAAIVFTPPGDVHDSFGVSIEVAKGRLRRRFEVQVEMREPFAIELTLDRASYQPGTMARALGRLFNRTTQAAVANTEVALTWTDGEGAPLRSSQLIRTDGAGLFLTTWTIPNERRDSIGIRARVQFGEEREVTAQATAVVIQDRARNLLVAVRPSDSVVAPGGTLTLDIAVRQNDGLAIADAALRISGIVPSRTRRIRTDQRGRAQVRWTAPDTGAELNTVTIEVTATSADAGSGTGAAEVRVTRARSFAGLAIEGAGIPLRDSRLKRKLYVRVVDARGRPAAEGTEIRVQGPHGGLAQFDERLDSDGVAIFDVDADAPSADDPCAAQEAITVAVTAMESTTTRCVPIDRDALVALHSETAIAAPGGRLEIGIERAPAAQRSPVLLTLLLERGNQKLPISQHVLAPNETSRDLEIPEGVLGSLVVRARPLLGTALEEVRGTSIHVLSLPDAAVFPTLHVDVRDGVAQIEAPDSEARVFMVALPIDDARALRANLRSALSIEAILGLGENQHPPRGEAAIFGYLASLGSSDEAAPGAWLDGQIVSRPMPSDSGALGLLRDPWRTRARFIEGRLGLVLRAIESRVESTLPDALSQVAVRVDGAWKFNDNILSSIDNSTLGSAGATGLGGEALSISALVQMDPSIRYDNVARRVTRARLYKLMLALREFVRSNQLDLTWTRRGEPASWLESLAGRYASNVGTIEPRLLVDAWGKPFELIPVRAAQRFSLFQPIAGYELVSAGPDGRAGNGDDVYDPTARILASDSIYGRAVGEDSLVARLRGVELGRATVESALQVLGDGIPAIRYESERGAFDSLASWRVPPVFELDSDALALRRPFEKTNGAGGVLTSLRASRADIPLRFEEEPRRWGVLAWAMNPRGVGVSALEAVSAGSSVLSTGELPTRLRAGDVLDVPLRLTQLKAQNETYQIRVSAFDGLEIEAPREVALEPEVPRLVSLKFTATHAPAEGNIRIELLTARGDVARTLSTHVRLDKSAHPVRERASGFVGNGSWSVEMDLPDTVSRLRTEIEILSAEGLADDSALAERALREPACIGWFKTVRGLPLSDSLKSRIFRSILASGNAVPLSRLGAACAIVVIGSMPSGEPDVVRARETLLERIHNSSQDDAAVLAALAIVGSSDASSNQGDTLNRVVHQLRGQVRRTIHDAPDSGTRLAKASAALLLSDPADGHGQAMFERVLRKLDDDARVRVLDEESNEDRFVATAALAIAAHQLGRMDIALRSLRRALSFDSVFVRGSEEASLWYLALGAYGILGTPNAEQIELRVDGHDHPITLEGGRALVQLDWEPGSSHDVEIRVEGSRGIFARLAAHYRRPFVEADGAMTLAIEGDPGQLARAAAFELSITAKERVSQPVIEIEIPAGVENQVEWLEGLRRHMAIRSVEFREPGFVRVILQSLRAEQRVDVSLPLPWFSSGRVQGLAAVAYPLDEPHRIAVLPSRLIAVPADAETRAADR